MFRRKENTMTPDHFYEADLTKLGFFINEVGQIRMIEAPEKEYVFHSTSDERVNEMRREAMQECSRREVEKRLSALGISRIYLPEFRTEKPEGPHVPILAPSPEVLKTRKRILVIVNDATQDLGILAYRHIQRELGLNGGSLINLVKEIIKRSANKETAVRYENIFEDSSRLEDNKDTPALVVLNTGQLLYSHKYNKAMTMRSWSAMPRKSVMHDMIKIHDIENRVEGHRDAKEHVKSVFENVLCNPERVAPDAEVYVIAIEGGTEYVLDVLGKDFQKYGARITAMALVHSLIDDSQIRDPNVRAFLHQRAREWKYSDDSSDPKDCTELPQGYESGHDPHSDDAGVIRQISWNEDVTKAGVLTGITNALQRLAINISPANNTDGVPSAPDSSTDWSTGTAICPMFAGGLESAGECILTNCSVQDAILSFFEKVAQDPSNYRNPNFKLYTSAPQPSADSPLALDPDDPTVVGFSSLAPELTSDQAELDMAKEKFKQMKLALAACPSSVPELQKGRAKLVQRITKQETRIEKLEKKALAMGGLKAGEASEQRENWKPLKEGHKVKFAGTEVDSELLKATGLLDAVEEEPDKHVT